MTANTVVIADDENLDIARAFGFETIEMDNSHVGRKVNAGFEFASAQGADYVTFVGSDDWLHIDLFEQLMDLSSVVHKIVITGREITLVDLSRGVLTRMRGTSLHHGVIPWLIPTSLLSGCGYRPMPEHLNKGLDHALYMHIRDYRWLFHDPHPHTRVDFKSDTNITPYSRMGRVAGNTPEEPLCQLKAWYPEELVDLAEEFA